MNTPAHLALNLAVLGKDKKPYDWLIISIGALLPDLPLFAMFFMRGILSEPVRQTLMVTSDVLNSVPIFAFAIIAGWLLKVRMLWLFAASSLLHIAFDLPLHAQDAHTHFFPVTDWVFNSPVSFWDANHFGTVFGTIEGVVFMVAAVIIWRRTKTWWGKSALIALSVIYLFTFIHFLGHALGGGHWAVI